MLSNKHNAQRISAATPWVLVAFDQSDAPGVKQAGVALGAARSPITGNHKSPSIYLAEAAHFFDIPVVRLLLWGIICQGGADVGGDGNGGHPGLQSTVWHVLFAVFFDKKSAFLGGAVLCPAGSEAPN
jgi:hypothetical protein